MKKRFCLTIYGRVQGVSFRYHTREKARELGIAGYVQNQPDGTVYAEGEGDAQAMEKWIHWCRRGPDFARVDRVTMVEKDAKGFSGFQIRRPR